MGGLNWKPWIPPKNDEVIYEKLSQVWRRPWQPLKRLLRNAWTLSKSALSQLYVNPLLTWGLKTVESSNKVNCWFGIMCCIIVRFPGNCLTCVRVILSLQHTFMYDDRAQNRLREKRWTIVEPRWHFRWQLEVTWWRFKWHFSDETSFSIASLFDHFRTKNNNIWENFQRQSSVFFEQWNSCSKQFEVDQNWKRAKLSKTEKVEHEQTWRFSSNAQSDSNQNCAT